jgi:5,10-methylenetetrahydromethanopterin reductase
MVEFWRGAGTSMITPVERAPAIEAEGWDCQMFMDSQSLSGDPFVKMGAWARATERLKLATGVANPLTRHPAVTAASIATVQDVSGGRATLGFGRGDSALAYLGYGPVKLAAFRRALEQIQTLLGGGEVDFADFERASVAPSLDALSLGGRPSKARLGWIKDMPKVPLDVAATGPKVIEMAAPLAEQVTFSVGAMPERMAWALDLARAARRAAGLPEDGASYGAQVLVVCHPDIEAMREIATSIVAPFARFQVMQGKAAGPMSGPDAENFEAVRLGYDMRQHGVVVSKDKVQGGGLSWDFVRRFAIVGPPDHCVERLLQLVELGLERFVVVGPAYHPEATPDGGSLFAREVMPAVRAAARRQAG